MGLTLQFIYVFTLWLLGNWNFNELKIPPRFFRRIHYNSPKLIFMCSVKYRFQHRFQIIHVLFPIKVSFVEEFLRSAVIYNFYYAFVVPHLFYSPNWFSLFGCVHVIVWYLLPLIKFNLLIAAVRRILMKYGAMMCFGSRTNAIQNKFNRIVFMSSSYITPYLYFLKFLKWNCWMTGYFGILN